MRRTAVFHGRDSKTGNDIQVELTEQEMDELTRLWNEPTPRSTPTIYDRIIDWLVQPASNKFTAAMIAVAVIYFVGRIIGIIG